MLDSQAWNALWIERLKNLAEQLQGQDMKQLETLNALFCQLDEEEQVEEAIYMGDDLEDDHYHMDALELTELFSELTMPELVLARQKQAERAVKRRLKQKAVGLMFRQCSKPVNCITIFQKYPDIAQVVDRLLKAQGHGANARRNTSEAFAIHRSNAKGAGYRGVHAALRQEGYEVSYREIIYLGSYLGKCTNEARKYKNAVDMVMRRMVKKYMEDNVDRRHQMAQYDGFNHILETLRRADEQVHIGIYERDDHSITRSGIGA
jgi:hypothetical protein